MGSGSPERRAPGANGGEPGRLVLLRLLQSRPATSLAASGVQWQNLPPGPAAGSHRTPLGISWNLELRTWNAFPFAVAVSPHPPITPSPQGFPSTPLPPQREARPPADHSPPTRRQLVEATTHRICDGPLQSQALRKRPHRKRNPDTPPPRIHLETPCAPRPSPPIQGCRGSWVEMRSESPRYLSGHGSVSCLPG